MVLIPLEQGHLSIVAGVGFAAAWLAAVARMPWWKFLLRNAAGGIAWAALVALVVLVVQHLLERRASPE